MEEIVYLNGKYLPIEQATVSVTDRGFLFGDGIYDVISLYGGKPFYAQRHLQRLRHGLKKIDVQLAMTDAEIMQVLQQLLEKNKAAPQQIFYIQVTRGASQFRSHVFEEVKPTFYARLQSIEPKDLSAGIKVITCEDTRWNRADVKSINLLPNVLMAQAAQKQGAAEAIILSKGFVLEGATSNVLIVEGDKVITAPLSHEILGGITREIVMSVASEFAAVKEEQISKERLLAADEVWITSSSRGIAPVVQIDEQLVGKGAPGEFYQKALGLYEQRIAQLTCS